MLKTAKVNIQIIEKIHLIVFYGLIGTIAFFPIIQSVLFGVFIIISLTQFRSFSITPWKDFFYISFPFWISIIFLLESTVNNSVLNFVLRSSIIFIFPLLLLTTNLKNKVSIFRFKKVYVIGVLISVTISLLISTFYMISESDYTEIMYFKLSSHFKLHPSYYSLYVILAFEFTSSLLLSKKNEYLIKIIFVFFLVLLNSKLGLIIVLVHVIKDLIKWKKKSDLVVTLFLIFLVSGFYLTNNSRLKDLKNFSIRDSIGEKSENGVSQRIWIWNEILVQTKSNVLFGKGTGSYNSFFSKKVHKKLLKKELLNSYESAAIKVSKKNSHNQYLKYLYEYGIIGLFLVLILIVKILTKAKDSKKYDFLFGFCVFLIYLLFENLLDRQMGIYFYAIILSSLYFLNQTYREKSNRKHKLDKTVD